MALPPSGAISLNEMHIEAGGSSGTQVTINDLDVRNLIGKGAGVEMSFDEWYGASNAPTWDLNAVLTALAARFSDGAAYAGMGFETSGNVQRYVNTTSSSQPTPVTIDAITNPAGDTNNSDYEFRVGDFNETSLSPGQPSRAGSAVSIPVGAIASQSWNSFSSSMQYYYAVTTGKKSCTFNIQFRHTSSGDTSAVKEVTLDAGFAF